MVVMRVAYEQVFYQRAGECVRGIRQRVDHGWQITEIRGSHDGPFLVIFRIDGVDTPSRRSALASEPAPTVAESTRPARPTAWPS